MFSQKQPIREPRGQKLRNTTSEYIFDALYIPLCYTVELKEYVNYPVVHDDGFLGKRATIWYNIVEGFIPAASLSPGL